MTISFDELKSKPIITPVAKTQSNSTENILLSILNTKDKNNRKKLALTLSGLAVLGITTFYMCKNRGRLSKDATRIIVDYAKDNIMNHSAMFQIINKLPKTDRQSFWKACSDITSKTSKLEVYSKNPKESIEILKYIFAGKKNNLKNFSDFPNFVYLTGLEDNFAKDMTHIINDVFGANFKTTRYTQGYAKEFIEMMKELSLKAKVNNKTSFIHFENLGVLVDDLNKPENKELLSEFKMLLAQHKDNNIVYFVNKNLSHEVYPRKQINLEFMNTATPSAFKEELEQLVENETIAKSQLETNIINELSVFMHKIDAYNIAKKSEVNILLLSNSQGNLIDSLLTRFISITEDVHKKITTDGTIMDLIKNINEQIIKAEEYFTRTQNKTFVTIDDFETILSKADINSDEFKELSELLKKLNDKHITLVLPNSNNNSLQQLLSDNKFVTKIAFDKDNIRKYFFNYEALGKSGESFKQRLNLLSLSIDIEKSGRKMKNGNGIFLYGNAEKIDKAETIIKNTLDVNFQESIYDPTQPFESIKNLVAIAEKGEADYPTTRKRTMIKLVDWDKLLTDEESRESCRMIGLFKQFVEHCSEKYHTTVLLKTTRAMEEFEDASIASHRFETQFKLI